MKFGSIEIDFSRPHVMGVLNVTPDSFSDGGQFNSLDSALFRAEEMVSSGATFIDIGGESTRPGAAVVTLQEEMDRVLPVVEKLSGNISAVISVDSSSPELLAEAASLGMGLINDVRALQKEGALSVAAESGLPICLMHMQGSPQTMQENPTYHDALSEIKVFFEERIAACVASGINKDNLILDPGFGFGKTLTHNLMLLKQLKQFESLKLPLLVGLSRKSMLGQITGKEVGERMAASVSAAVLSAMNGANIIRVHDVAETVDALKVVQAVMDV
ncbi:dihydropteroate synthase [Litoribrevibacter albus]|uniref:Dihydropteroate synthase n=1 Tax=Litoribrevibacter albus TaxID=1473156 RepID=A0AA37S5L0_9GAMM|nr:dihydropteroate synthase [Litoribrevibacter albus]GLQ29691.1 dihydropteroate synthase [Litoribrevibacter albus]